MARNRSFNVTYVLSKSMDDTSTLGGGVVQIVERHPRRNAPCRITISGTASHSTIPIQSPVGADRTSWRWHAIRGWTLEWPI